MFKQTLRKLSVQTPLRRGIAAALSVLVLCSLFSCRQTGTNPKISDTSPADPAPAGWVLAQDGKSAYSIVVDYNNTVEKQYAMALQLRLYTLCGAMLPLRNAASGSAESVAGSAGHLARELETI